ncbi:MAG: transposase, partial [Alphaproteobacteria bacterium]|nr:transposase [Alphaproteobacteria bacterium]
IEPIQSEDAHRPLYQDAAKLRQILSQQSTRKLSKNLEISHNRLIYQIEQTGKGYHLRNFLNGL